MRGCNAKGSGYGLMFWTAGQRKDPGRLGSKFVWRLMSVKGYSKVTEMKYINWSNGKPNQQRNETCVMMFAGRQYSWNGHNCDSEPACAVCQLDVESD